MNKLSKNQKGFGIWELLLLLLLLLLLIFIFWWVLEQNKKNQESNQPQSNVEVQQNTEKKKTAPKKKKPAAKYLEIKELGIKLKLNAATDDAYYEMKNGYAYLSLTSLKNVDDCAALETGIAAVGQYGKDDTDEQTGKAYSTEGTVIGSYAYTIDSAQAYCTTKPAEQKIAEAARSAFPKLTVVKL